jgi:hypothetical protein
MVLGGAAAWALSRKPTPRAPAPPALPAAPPAPTTKTEAEKALVDFAMDPGMPTALAEGVAGALVKEQDPAKLDGWADQVETLGFPNSAKALRAKAASLRALKGAGAALQKIDDIIKDKPEEPAPSAPAVRDKARETVQKAAEVAAAQQPALTEAAGKAAEAATAAARAATTGDPVEVEKAATKAAEAAAAVLSPVGQSKAATAVAAATEAVAEPTPENIQKAAAAATDAATQAMTDAATQIVQPGGPTGPAPVLAVEPPPAPVLDPAIVQLAERVAADVRAKGKWKEDRALVKQFQLADPAAGKADGLYGPKTAITLSKYVSKVPAPLYWPSSPTTRDAAKADWAELVAQGGFTVGRLGRSLTL